MSNSLIKLLCEYGCPENAEFQERLISDCPLTVLQLRDRLMLIGDILCEDTKNSIYVVAVRTGAGNMNFARIAVQLNANRINMVGYAKEGAIKQHLCEKAFQKIENAVHSGTVEKASKPGRFLSIIIAVIVLASFVCIRNYVLNSVDKDKIKDELSAAIPSTTSAEQSETVTPTEDPVFVAEIEKTIEATKGYNAAVKAYNSCVAEYNEAVTLTCIDNLAGLPYEFEELSYESEVYDDVEAAVLNGVTKEAIVTDTDTITKMTQQVTQATVLVKQITAPSGEWVTERLAMVDGITGTQMVTEAQNPDGLLGKEGGYSDCVYFALSVIDQKEVPGGSIVAKGTDAGGAVEVYPTLADAEARVEYLAGFDGTVLYSGSYAIVGTMVIRTSYKLTDEQQIEFTKAITAAMTSVLQDSE